MLCLPGSRCQRRRVASQVSFAEQPSNWGANRALAHVAQVSQGQACVQQAHGSSSVPLAGQREEVSALLALHARHCLIHSHGQGVS